MLIEPLTPAKALATIKAMISPIGDVESAALSAALGRVLAVDIIAPQPQPQAPTSAMDGFAVRMAEAKSGALSCTATLPAGRVDAALYAELSATLNTAPRIFTGAIVPNGFDTVIMQEDAVLDEGSVRFTSLPKQGANIIQTGESLKKGALCLQAGQRLGARQIALLASFGMQSVEVFRRPKVAFFSTGDELRQPGETLAAGEIYNSNRFMLLALLGQAGVEIMDMGAVADDAPALKTALKQGFESADMVITTGGVSVGQEDHMPRLFAELGGQLQVMKVAVKPGKPLKMGQLDVAGSARYFAGLPGNPQSAFATFSLFVKPALDWLAGSAPVLQPMMQVKAGADYSAKAGRTQYITAVLQLDESGAAIATPLGTGSSANLATLAQASGFIVLEPASTGFAVGDEVQFQAL